MSNSDYGEEFEDLEEFLKESEKGTNKKGIFFKYLPKENAVIVGTELNGKQYKAPVYLSIQKYERTITNSGNEDDFLELISRIIIKARKGNPANFELVCARNIAKSNVERINAVYGKASKEKEDGDKSYDEFIEKIENAFSKIKKNKFQTKDFMDNSGLPLEAANARTGTREFAEHLICLGAMRKTSQGESDEFKKTANWYEKCDKKTCSYWDNSLKRCNYKEKKKFRKHKKGTNLLKEEL